ncbi:hypothetical protein [Sandaracinobacteroides saxicola]|uniref:Uncharacterized protein n=1 Tax=Sandaracinobacteroides saxicola TaxID=2759707 RepID=A0A7G5IFE9_9SPHN|nr:hypothetical protein [Sandaracinobacteroides saxicola]QMW22091.1 hypothetical protein H3309_12025 [Sandaracinobacteroides saxicola]
MPLDPVSGGLIKFVIDRIAKWAATPEIEKELRSIKRALREAQERADELEAVNQLFERMEAQRDAFQAEAIRLRLRVAELESELSLLRRATGS